MNSTGKGWQLNRLQAVMQYTPPTTLSFAVKQRFDVEFPITINLSMNCIYASTRYQSMTLVRFLLIFSRRTDD